MNKSLTHMFMICAYKESPFLEECVESIMNQNITTKVGIATSTPNDYIKGIAEKYQIPLFINNAESGIAQDWNFAYKMADVDLVTLAHQDDVYLPHYTQEILKMVESEDKPLIAFTDYGELRNGQPILKNTLLTIKRILAFPMNVFGKNKLIRRRCLSLGNCICCPAVTFMKKNLPDVIFKPGFRSNIDWEAWEKISHFEGAFLRSSKIGMYHRIHDGSETSATIVENVRIEEDYEMFKKFWPEFLVKIIIKAYAKSEDSNQV